MYVYVGTEAISVQEGECQHAKGVSDARGGVVQLSTCVFHDTRVAADIFQVALESLKAPNGV